MKGTQILKNIFHQITYLGVTDDMPFKEKLRTQLCNLFIVIALPPTLIQLAYNFFGPNDLVEHGIAIGWLIILSIPLYLNYRKQYLAARSVVVLVPLFLESVLFLMRGFEIRLESIYLLQMLVSSYFFPRKYAIAMCVLIASAYTAVAIYLSYFGAPYPIGMVDSAPYMYFSFAMTAALILTNWMLKENRNYNRLLQENNRQLAEKNDELERFAYIASHDLKSPLRNIASFAGLLEKELDEGNHESLKDYLTFIQSNAKQMTYLIKDILEFSQINSQMDERKAKIDLNEIVAKVLYALAEDIKNADAQIICHDLPVYECNEAKFCLLFQNLIQNGIKYNKSTPPVLKIWGEEKENEWWIYFQDNGIGIEAAYHQKIFEYFRRLHSRYEYEGTGIGLGLCKKIVEYYQGSITVYSVPGEGSTFLVKLPHSGTGALPSEQPLEEISTAFPSLPS
ncbi:MAG: ATP-binding protein [Bacteroidota bacterium]